MSGHHVKAMFHSTAIERDYDEAVASLGALFGLRVLEYGVSDDPTVGRRGGMTWLGDGSLELAEPVVTGAAPDRFLQRTRGGMQGVALWVDDFGVAARGLAATLATLATKVTFEASGDAACSLVTRGAAPMACSGPPIPAPAPWPVSLPRPEGSGRPKNAVPPTWSGLLWCARTS
ncbi:MAG TPA: VOC family protein [Acidimicrobiales bacterium]|nr:VOC family protein [Acidimicrobiales bacterium]